MRFCPGREDLPGGCQVQELQSSCRAWWRQRDLWDSCWCFVQKQRRISAGSWFDPPDLILKKVQMTSRFILHQHFHCDCGLTVQFINKAWSYIYYKLHRKTEDRISSRIFRRLQPQWSSFIVNRDLASSPTKPTCCTDTEVNVLVSSDADRC